jgi:integrase
MPKKREHGEGSLLKIYRKERDAEGKKIEKSPFWFAQYYAADGRQIRTSTKKTVKAEALAVLRKLMADRDSGIQPITDTRKISYADLRRGLIASYEERGNRSLLSYADGEDRIPGLRQLDNFFKFSTTNPGPSVLDITVDTARDFAKARKAEGVGNAVINRSLACLRRMLRIAYEDDKILKVPIVRLLKEPPARRGFVTEEQFGTLLKFLPTHLRPFITLLFFTGVRKGEALSIEWSQIDLADGLIRLYKTKNDEPRVIPIPSLLRMMLAEVEPKTGLVFCDTNLRKEWMEACVRAGLGTKIEVEGKPYDPRYVGLTIHDMRRSAARNLVRSGTAETFTMKIGGWKTRSVFDRYAIASETDLTAAMRRVETNGLGETLVKLALPAKRRKALKPA